ncbi:MAG: LptF/LptG family permease [Bacteroidales bacterium]|uniref:LptF/LptG family permease n=1 Tax=Porphyromonas sp. TaxID=1924944 RepID=UPI002970A8A1|nr:LptF/LptG family permease [Porphyromonas sp.]MDD7438119.1 LptF/LptG family permease [Bacteroidales bacterium]MDY3066417.1 LptF/LptG family permease [Porphyromonas sp.]
MKGIGLKKLYIYILKNFFPLLLGGFAVSLFVVVMQFLWQSIGDLVGKGVDGDVLLKLLFFASMTMVPLALTLGILVASLMTFGNLGDRMELLAMKAAGIPLWKIFKPVFYFVISLAIGLFIFQNDWMITSQVKFWQYYFSIRNKSPELAIPEGSFFRDLQNYSIYVERKDNKAKMMYGIMLYDYSNGFNNSMVVVADSGRLYSTMDGKELILELYYGESFQNLRKSEDSYYNSADRPFIRERFSFKELHIPFNNDLNMMDESVLSSQFVGKNVVELKQYTDSLQVEIDSISQINRHTLLQTNTYVLTLSRGNRVPTLESVARAAQPSKVISAEAQEEQIVVDPNAPNVFAELPQEEKERHTMVGKLDKVGASVASGIYDRALTRIANLQNDNYFSVEDQREKADLKRKNEAEYWRKFTYPVACIAFFLIGAPLGALIRKGGMGVPFLVAISFFIIFYILETTGIKMVREGTLVNWFGMWLPNIVLIPVGLGLGLLATKDTNRFSFDKIVLFFRRYILAGTKRTVAYREVSMQTVDYASSRQNVEILKEMVAKQREKRVVGYVGFFLNEEYFGERQGLLLQLESLVGHLSHSRDYLLVDHLNGYPDLVDLMRAWRSGDKRINRALMYLFPVGLICYLVYILRNKRYIVALNKITHTSGVILADIGRIEEEYKS